MAIQVAFGESSACTLWSMTQAANETRCVVVVTPAGFEAQLRMNRTLLYSYTLPNLYDVSVWAEDRRARFARRGWTMTHDEEVSIAEDPYFQPVALGVDPARYSAPVAQ